jgi:hypothetical protein
VVGSGSFLTNKSISCPSVLTVGKGKPWEQNRYALYYHLEVPADTGKPKTDMEQWYYTLKIVEKRANVKANFDFIINKLAQEAPPVGRFSNYRPMLAHIKEKAYHNWTVYEGD